jgi:hypothetical protein
MSKAHGRVLIDKNTYSNLNQSTRALLIAAEEMKLKGMEHPIIPYQYNSDVIPRVAALDESPGFSTILRKQVKAILSSQMDKITNGYNETTGNTGLPGSSGGGGGTVVVNNTNASTADLSALTLSKSVYFTIILGMPGTGKSTAAEYFRHGLRKRNIPVILIQARPGHEGVPYGLMRELFLELIGEDNFLTESQQKRKIKYLIEQAYPNANEEEKRRAKLSLQLLLGVEWTNEAEFTRSPRTSNQQKEKSQSSSQHHQHLTSSHDMSSDGDESSSGILGSYIPKIDSSASDKSHYVDTSPKTPIRVLSPRGGTGPGIESPRSNSNVAVNNSLSPRGKEGSSNGGAGGGSGLNSPNNGTNGNGNGNGNGSDKENLASTMLENYETTLCRPVGDMTFYKVLSVLLRNQRSAIIIEDAHFCDELSWNELHLLLIGTELNLVVLLTMRSNNVGKQNGIAGTIAALGINENNIGGAVNNGNVAVSGNVAGFGEEKTHTRRGSVLSRAAENFPGNTINDTDLGGTRFGFKSQTSVAYLSILGHENSTVIEMNSLTESEVKEILLHTLKVETISPDLVRLVLDVSSGNAFWCKAIANFINERGVKELEKATEGDSSQALKQLIILRMEKLPMDTQLILRHASILGDEFSENMLESAITEKLKTVLSESLDTLVEHGFILCIEEFPQLIFGFQNQLIRQTVYELTPPR